MKLFQISIFSILFAATFQFFGHSAQAFGEKKSDGTSSASEGQNSSSMSTPSSPANTVWVTRSDGSKMCSANSGQTLEEGSAELQKSHVKVITAQKGNDKKMHAQMCGLPSGHTNAYQISRDDLPKANVLGFQEITPQK